MSQTRLSILGAGRWGPNIIRNLDSHPLSQVVHVADPSREMLNRLEGRYEGVHLTQSVDEAMDDPTIDAVVICSPTSTHFELAKRALESGKHVFVEKPLAKTEAECAALSALAQERERVLFVGHIFVYNAGIVAVKKAIQEGQLGRISYVHCTRTNLGPFRSDINVLWDLGPHDLSILRYWFDESPIAVNASGGIFLDPGREDVVFATYRYGSGAMAHLHLSWLNPKKVREIVVVGDKKMLVWNDLDPTPVSVYDRRVEVGTRVVDTLSEFTAVIHEGTTDTIEVGPVEPLRAELEAFLLSLQDPSACRSTGEDGLAVVRELIYTQQSLAEGGREVAIP